MRLVGLHECGCCVKNGLDLTMRMCPGIETISWTSLRSNQIPFFQSDNYTSLPPVNGIIPLPSLQLPNWQIVPSRFDCHVSAPTCYSFESSAPETTLTFVSESSSKSAHKTRIVERSVDVTEDMKRMAKEMAFTNWIMLPDKIWDTITKEMNNRPSTWMGINRDQITKLVKDTRAGMGGVNKIKILENDNSSFHSQWSSRFYLIFSP